MKWLIGILSLVLIYGITTGLGHLGHATRESGWGVLLLIALPLVVAGALFYFGLKWWVALGIGGICLGLTAAGRAGFIIGVGMLDD